MSNRVWVWAGLRVWGGVSARVRARVRACARVRVWGGVSAAPLMTHTRVRACARACACAPLALAGGIAAMITTPAIAVAPAPIPADACYWDDGGDGGVHFVRVGLATYDVTR